MANQFDALAAKIEKAGREVDSATTKFLDEVNAAVADSNKAQVAAVKRAGAESRQVLSDLATQVRTLAKAAK